MIKINRLNPINLIPILGLCFFIFLFLTKECINCSNCTPAKSGFIDLTKMNTDQVILLDGEWGIFEGLKNPNAIKNSTPDYYTSIPISWDKTAFNNVFNDTNKIYRLHVKLNIPIGTFIGLKTESSNEYYLFIDNELIKYDKNSDQKITFYKTKAKEFDISIFLTNNVSSIGSYGFRIFLGTADNMHIFNNSMIVKESSLIGALLIIAMFFAALSIYIKNVRYTAYFSIACFLIALVVDIGCQKTYSRQLAFLGASSYITIWYSSFCWLMYFVILFLQELYPSRLSSIISNTLKYITICEQFVFIWLPVNYYIYISNIIFIIGFFICISAAFIVAKGIKNNFEDSELNMISIFILIVVFIHDVLFTRGIIGTTNRIYIYGIYLILINQVLIQARRIKQNYEQKYIAELSFLQAQIKPHFLYNVMNTFISVSRIDPEKARDLMYDFSIYLRNCFDVKYVDKFVMLKYEINLATAYLEIEKARFYDRIEVVWELPESLEYLVPPVMLQPIIENAVNHGLLPKPDGGRIEIKIVTKAKSIEFSVRDNGIGMNEIQLKELLFSKKEGSIGLINIKKRLKMLYNTDLKIKSKYGMGTEITWQIPIKINEERLHDKSCIN